VCVAATKGTLGILATLPSRNSVSNNCSQVRQSPLDTMEKNQEEDDNLDTADIEWDDQYDNPDEKIVLVSNDNVGFRVDAWYFMKKRYVRPLIMADRASGLIENLLYVPSRQPLESAPFRLEYESDIIRTFIHLIYSNHPVNEELLLPEGYQSLMEVCDLFDADPVYKLVSEMLCSQISIKVKEIDCFQTRTNILWATLKLGILRSDITLSKAAIAAMDPYDLEEIFFDKSAESLDRFDDMPPKTVYRLLTCVLIDPRSPARIAAGFSFP